MKKKKLSLILALTLAFSTVNVALGAWTLPNRIYGENRYKTSVAIAESSFKKAQNVVISSGEDYPDALSSVPLALKLDAPILLTSKKSLSKEVKEEIKKLEAKNVYIIGGKAAVSKEVENELTSLNLKVNRISGQNRYKTSLEVCKSMGEFKNVVLTTGGSYEEALSISPIAGKLGMPIVLTDGKTIDENTLNILNGKDIEKVYVVGGEKDIPTSLIKNVKNIERIGARGDKDLIDVEILNYFKKDLSSDGIIIARGESNVKDSFADALSSTVLAAKNNLGILLINKEVNSEEKSLIERLNKGAKILAVGGEKAISEELYKNIEALLPKEAGTVTPGGGGTSGGNTNTNDEKEKIELLNYASSCMPYIQRELNTNKQKQVLSIAGNVVGALLSNINYDFSSEKAEAYKIKASMTEEEYNQLKSAVTGNMDVDKLYELRRVFGV